MLIPGFEQVTQFPLWLVLSASGTNSKFACRCQVQLGTLPKFVFVPWRFNPRIGRAQLKLLMFLCFFFVVGFPYTPHKVVPVSSSCYMTAFPGRSQTGSWSCGASMIAELQIDRERAGAMVLVMQVSYWSIHLGVMLGAFLVVVLLKNTTLKTSRSVTCFRRRLRYSTILF